jgi:poly-gamma-glutamate synthesis protein (capsule biosynthesis protein)
VRIVNLETSITTSAAREPKGINYRMHLANVACLTAARIDCCNLANNHVLDWGYPGLAQTLATLHNAKLKTTGAGENPAQVLSRPQWR